MSLYSFLGAIELGLIFSLVALGVYISFRILNFPDLTVDGSFPLGAASTAIFTLSGIDPIYALLLAFLLGSCAGLITAWLHVKFNILHLLASILTMIALYSINLRIMGKPNVSLIHADTIFTPFEIIYSSIWLKPIGLFIIILLIKIILDYFLTSDLGLAMRATGSNQKMARANGINTGHMIYLGMGISNGLVALAGGLFTQTNAFADVLLGQGVIIFGLASVIIGESLFSTRIILYATLACILGSILYRLVVALALNADFLGFEASDLNLVTALLVAFALILPSSKKKLKLIFKKEEA